MARKSKFRAEQIAYALKQVEAGVPMADVFRKYAAGGSCGPHLDVQSNPKPRGLEALRWTGKWGQARCGPPPASDVHHSRKCRFSTDCSIRG